MPMTLAFEFYTCVIRDAVASATKHNSQEEAWARFHQVVGDSTTFAAVAYLDLTILAQVHLLASFTRHDASRQPAQLSTQAIISIETLRDLTDTPSRFKLGPFWDQYAERVKRIPESEFPFMDGTVWPPAYRNPGMILHEEETMMRRARLGVPAAPGQSPWFIRGDGSMMTTGRYRLIPYERILREPQ